MVRKYQVIEIDPVMWMVWSLLYDKKKHEKYITYFQQCIVEYILDYLKVEFLILEPALAHDVIVS